MNIKLVDKKDFETLICNLNMEDMITVSNINDIGEEDIIVCDIEDSAIIDMIKMNCDDEDCEEDGI